MARARNIKPGFFKNEDLAECTMAARLCFAGLWTLADREGRLEDRAKRIKGELFPFDSVEVEPLLEELAKWGFILRYTVDGLGIIQILAFHKHQNPHHRELPSELPPPPSPGLDPDGNSREPQAPPPSQPPPAPGQPQASPGLDPPKSDLARGSSRADSGFLIPDSPSLIPDTGEKESAGVCAITAGEATKAMRQAGIADANPGHPTLLALLAGGITLDELRWAAADSVRRGNGFAYALTVAESARRKAAGVGTLPAARAPAPRAEPEWRREQRERMAQAAPYAVARPSRATAPTTDEVTDVLPLARPAA